MRPDWQHFWLAVIVLVGGGVLWSVRPETGTAVCSFWGAVVAFYFAHRSNGNGCGNGNGGGH